MQNSTRVLKTITIIKLRTVCKNGKKNNKMETVKCNEKSEAQPTDITASPINVTNTVMGDSLTHARTHARAHARAHTHTHTHTHTQLITKHLKSFLTFTKSINFDEL